MGASPLPRWVAGISIARLAVLRIERTASLPPAPSPVPGWRARRLGSAAPEAEAVALTREAVAAKAVGIAYSMRGALDYIVWTPREALNRRALDLYYGTMALAQAEMLASPSGPVDGAAGAPGR